MIGTTMAHTTPVVRNGVLDPGMTNEPHADALSVGSLEWFTWLETHRSFAYKSGDGTITVRKERRSGGWYWYAYRRYQGKLYSTYIGRSEDLTPERLESAAQQLHVRAAQAQPLDTTQPRNDTPGSQQDALLMTKLCIPPVRRDLVPRKRLLDQLNMAIRRKLTLILAPAGFGKTTSLSAWAMEAQQAKGNQQHDQVGTTAVQPVAAVAAPYTVAWVSLDADDNDPIRFWGYVFAALQTIEGSRTLSARNVFQFSQPLSRDVILATLLNTLSTIPGDVILIIDDYHLIETPIIHETLAFLIERMPSSLHLVIASRTDPPLPLARLRVQGELAELRQSNLRFTFDEVTAFLNQVMRLELSAEQVAALESQTEGWVAGLQLAALALQTCDDITSFIATFNGKHRYIVDYLTEEVLRRQPTHIYSFLLDTAPLNYLKGSLCDAVTERSDGQMMLELLERSNLFLIPLDSERSWYRYHPLFVDMLRQRLQQAQPDKVPLLHKRAASWYEANGMTAEGVRHALAAADFLYAARLIEQVGDTMLMHGELATLRGWLDTLPSEIVRSRPSLWLIQAWILLLSGDLNGTETYLQQAEQRLIAQMRRDAADSVATELDDTTNILGEIEVIRAYIASIRLGSPHTVQLARQVLERLPEDDINLRSIALLNLGGAYWLGGDLAAASQTFSEAAELGKASGNILVALSALNNLAQLEVSLGHLRKAATIYQQALQFANERGGPSLPISSTAYLGLAELLREWNDLATALRHLLEGVERIKQWGNAGDVVLTHIALARLYHAQGDEANAREMMQRAERLKHSMQLGQLSTRVAAAQARVWLLQGDERAAATWAAGVQPYAEAEVDITQEYIYLTLARVAIAQQRHEEALQLLDRLEQAAAERTGSLIEIMALQALALQASGKTEQALHKLAAALKRAEPEGYVRIFVDEGEAMTRLLTRLLKTQWPGSAGLLRDVSPSYVKRLLEAAEADRKQLHDEPQRPLASTASETPLVEPLSDREREVLRLIAAGLSNQEIASRLVLALSTVKTHTKSIYWKLNAKSRTQAVARARELNLL